MLACAVVTGCSNGPQESDSSLTDLPAGEWRLVGFVGADSTTPDVPTFESTLIVNTQERRIGGQAGCNRYMGGYEMTNGRLVVGSIAASKRLCPEPEMAQEERFLAWLGRASGALMSQETLVIATAEREELRFERMPATGS